MKKFPWLFTTEMSVKVFFCHFLRCILLLCLFHQTKIMIFLQFEKTMPTIEDEKWKYRLYQDFGFLWWCMFNYLNFTNFFQIFVTEKYGRKKINLIYYSYASQSFSLNDYKKNKSCFIQNKITVKRNLFS